MHGLLLAVLAVIYVEVIDRAILGFTHDDGVYAITAKALSQGKGFTLLHLVTEPPQVKYPILYPLILSMGWLINPNFPANLSLLSYITVAFTLGGLLMTMLYLKNIKGMPAWLAWAVVFLVGTNFYFLYYGTSIMSEGPYLFFSFLTLYYVERHLKIGSGKSLALLILLSVLTFHTRIIGVTLMAGIGCRLLAGRRYRQAAIYAAGCALFAVIPWFAWARFAMPEMTEASYPLLKPYSNYGDELLHHFFSGEYLSRVDKTFADLTWRLLENMFNIIPNFFRVVSSIGIFPDDYPQLAVAHVYVFIGSLVLLLGFFVIRMIGAAGRLIKRKTPLADIPADGWYLFFYTLVILLWSYQYQAGRFLLVVMPILWWYFFQPMLSNRTRWKTGLMVFFVALGLVSAPKTIYAIDYIRAHHWVESGKAPGIWRDYQAVFSYINENVPDSAVIATSQDAVFYLYTGNPNFYYSRLAMNGGDGEEFTEASMGRMMASMKHYGVSYLVVVPQYSNREIVFPVDIVGLALLRRFPDRFEYVYQSPSGVIRVFRLNWPGTGASSK